MFPTAVSVKDPWWQYQVTTSWSTTSITTSEDATTSSTAAFTGQISLPEADIGPEEEISHQKRHSVVV